MRPFEPTTNIEAFQANDVYEYMYEYAELPSCASRDPLTNATAACGHNPYLSFGARASIFSESYIFIS